MCLVHKQYHFAVKSVLRSQTVLRTSKLAEASIKKYLKIFWREVKRANAKIACSHAVNSVNGHFIPKDSANDFKDKYVEIFHAGFTAENNLSELHSELSELCKNN